MKMERCRIIWRSGKNRIVVPIAFQFQKTSGVPIPRSKMLERVPERRSMERRSPMLCSYFGQF